MLNQNKTIDKLDLSKFSSAYNKNSPIRKKHKYLSPAIGGTTVLDRSKAMTEFMETFKGFILTAGITQDMQHSLGVAYRTTVDPRWNTSAADKVSAVWTYLGAKFVIWSNGLNSDGEYEIHLYGDLLSGQYRSGGITSPEEFGRKFALLVCEAERIGRLPWTRKVPERRERLAQVLITFTMCVSFFVTPSNDWEKTDYFAAFFALTSCAALSYSSKIKPEDSLIDEKIEQQAIAI
jgi:hypothetical protein